MKASAVANANIALTKYWGKRDSTLMLPQNGSVSMTVSGMSTKTTVEFSSELEKDVFILNGKECPDGEEYGQTVAHLNLVREMAGIRDKAKVSSENNFPTAAGLASSASGFAALSMAASKAAGLSLDKKGLSVLARKGSGSASRSIEGGFVEWKRGEKEDGSDSYGMQVAPPEHWKDFRMVTVVTSRSEKKVKSRAGMSQTVKTCPYYPKWLETVGQDIEAVRQGILEKDFTKVGSTAERNCLKMHALMMTTEPAIIYWNAVTMRIIHSVMEWRDMGLECYFTIDAGPQVKIICLEKDVEEIEKRLKRIEGIEEVHLCSPGGAAKLTDGHLF
jgi:diphosphomevalonate decarboxylase